MVGCTVIYSSVKKKNLYQVNWHIINFKNYPNFRKVKMKKQSIS